MVTVAIPTYNGEKFIEYALKSVLDLSYPVQDIIIMDDASEDRTIQIIQKIQVQFPQKNVRYFINHQNMGYPINWNKCFEYCTTDYLLILHQDDMLKKNIIHKYLDFFNHHAEIALVGSQEDYINENGKSINKKDTIPNQIYAKNEIYEFVSQTGSYIPCSSVMFNMRKIRKVGFFDTDVIATDELYWPRVLTEYSIAVLGESLIYRRIHPGQTANGDFIKYDKKAIEFYEKFFRMIDYETRPKYQKRLTSFLKYKFSSSYIRCIAVSVAKNGERYIAIKYIGRAIRIYPQIILEFPKMLRSFARILTYFFDFRKQK